MGLFSENAPNNKMIQCMNMFFIYCGRLTKIDTALYSNEK